MDICDHGVSLYAFCEKCADEASDKYDRRLNHEEEEAKEKEERAQAYHDAVLQIAGSLRSIEISLSNIAELLLQRL